MHPHRYYVILSVWLHFAESMSGVAPPQRQGSAGLCFPATVGAVLAPGLMSGFPLAAPASSPTVFPPTAQRRAN